MCVFTPMSAPSYPSVKPIPPTPAPIFGDNEESIRSGRLFGKRRLQVPLSGSPGGPKSGLSIPTKS